MYLNDSTWGDIHNKRVKRWKRFNDFGSGIAFLYGVASFAFAIIFGALFLPDNLLVVLGAIAGFVVLAMIVHMLRRPNEQWLYEVGLLANRQSYAFTALETALSGLYIHIKDMNDKHDQYVGIVLIVDFVRCTRVPSGLVDEGHLKGEELTQLKAAIDEMALEAATRIRHNFDQRELARQQVERAVQEGVTRLRKVRGEGLGVVALTRAELWLADYRAGRAE